MKKWMSIAVVMALIGLVAFGALAAHSRMAAMNREARGECTGECDGQCEPMELKQMQQLRLQHLLGDGNGPHGNGGGRQMRRAGMTG